MEISMVTSAAANGNTTLINRLQDRAKSSETFNAMCHVFALRERSTKRISIHNLKTALAKEGFEFSREQLGAELKFMSQSGIGKLEFSPRGKLRSLGGITMTLQSIGMSAVAQNKSLKKQEVKPKFTKLPIPAAVQPEVTKVVPQETKKARYYEVGLTLIVDNENVMFPLPGKMTMQEFMELVSGLSKRTSSV